jgi:short-subunit dehydrogenase
VAKFALVGYSQGLRAELENNGIVVTTVCPGLMRTGSPRNADFKGQNEAEYAWFKISDSLPLLTISAEKAARAILHACQRGHAQVILSLPANLGVALQENFPETTSTLISLANRLMPRPGEHSDRESRKGKESETAWTETVVTRLTDKAAVRNNE